MPNLLEGRVAKTNQFSQGIYKFLVQDIITILELNLIEKKEVVPQIGKKGQNTILTEKIRQLFYIFKILHYLREGLIKSNKAKSSQKDQ